MKVIFSKQNENPIQVPSNFDKPSKGDWIDPLAKLSKKDPANIPSYKDITGPRNAQQTAVLPDHSVNIREINEMKEKIMFLEDEVYYNKFLI